MVTWSALRYNPVIKALYASCLAEGMAPRAAIGVCMHKIVRIVYGMLKHKTPFDPNIDQTNREKNAFTVSDRKFRRRVVCRRLMTMHRVRVDSKKNERNRRSPKTKESSRAGSTSLLLSVNIGGDIIYIIFFHKQKKEI
jgi:hypothetical protein